MPPTYAQVAAPISARRAALQPLRSEDGWFLFTNTDYYDDPVWPAAEVRNA